MNIDAVNEQEKSWLLKEKYNGFATDEYLKECRLIDEGMPVAYLIGNIEFLGCRIDLSSRPLIPRAETEYWVHQLIQKYKEKYSKEKLRTLKVLDIFSGSGCIGIALAKYFACEVDFAELKAGHCEQIQKNIDLNVPSKEQHEQFSIYQSDVLDTVPEKKYDLIVANPPYVPHSHRDTLVQNSVNDYEDPEAVYADDDGNALIKKLIDSLGDYLEPTGVVYTEHDPSQTKTLVEYISGAYNVKVLVDQYKRERVLKLETKTEKIL